MAEDPALAAWYGRIQRLAASPGEARTPHEAAAGLDVRETLPRIGVPDAGHAPATEIRRGTCATRAIWPRTSRGRATSSWMGADSLPFVGDSDAIVEEIEEFLTGARSGGEFARALLTVDIHRHRRCHRSRRGARRPPLARSAGPPRRGGPQGARPLRRARDQDGRRRLPGDIRRSALTRAALRVWRSPARRASRASRSASGCIRASAS